MAAELARDLIRTQDQLGPSDTVNLVFKLFNDRIPKAYATTRILEQDIGNAFTLGHAVNGVLGVANGVGGGQLTLGVGDLGASTISRVVSTNNTFVEAMRDTTYVDTDNTSATTDTGTHTITF